MEGLFRGQVLPNSEVQVVAQAEELVVVASAVELRVSKVSHNKVTSSKVSHSKVSSNKVRHRKVSHSKVSRNKVSSSRVSKDSSREVAVIMRAPTVKRPTRLMLVNIATNAERRATGGGTAR